MKKSTVFLGIIIMFLLLACSSTTAPDPYVPPEPQEPDSAWKVVWNLEYAYNSRDLNLYMSCFRDDFVFYPLVPWPEPWDYSTEEAIHDSMFGYVDDIDLTFSGSAEWLWSGDSTGQSWELQRVFDLNVFYIIPGSPSDSSRASGTAVFICRTDTTTGEWYIWKWFDWSETKGWMTWTGIKSLFLQAVRRCEPFTKLLTVTPTASRAQSAIPAVDSKNES